MKIHRVEVDPPIEIHGHSVVALHSHVKSMTIDGIYVLVVETDSGEGLIVPQYSTDDRRFQPIGPFPTPDDAIVVARLTADISK